MRKLIPLVALLCFSLFVLSPSLFATNWYVRPAGGNYGLENGTSYQNAWDGLLKIVWGSGGVQAGDTLYICGFHLFAYTGSSPHTGWQTINVSGTSGYHITIRGDYPGDPGEIHGGCLLSHEPWISEGSNTYSITNRGGGNGIWLLEDVVPNGSFKPLVRVASLASCKTTSGSYYCSDYGSTSARLYVHCSDGNAPTNRITYERFGYRFKCNGQAYIDWLNLKFYGLYQAFWYGPDGEYVSHMTWRGCRLWHQTFYPARNSHDITFDRCDIAWAPNGISVLGYAVGGITTCYNLTIKDCRIHDIGNWPTIYDSDAHAISSQGDQTATPRNFLFENNEIYNCGSGITIYIQFPNTNYSSTITRFNYIHDSHQHGGSNGRGIEYNMDGDNTGDKSGNKCYGNIVRGMDDVGYRSTWSKPGNELLFFNNVASNCAISYWFCHTATSNGLYITFKNNISISPTTRHIHFASASPEGSYKLASDHNIYFPISGTQFYFYDKGGASTVNFANWQIISKSGCTFDPSSRITDPQFTNSSGSYRTAEDFHLGLSSPAIDAGTPVGLNQDRDGVPIPQGGGPDIGAYEYVYGTNPLVVTLTATPTSGSAPLNVNFSGSASGGSSPYSYSWSFGDGQTSTAQHPSHTYSSPGDYNASLTVTDGSGAKAMKTAAIAVTSAFSQLVAYLDASPTSGQAPLIVNFTGSASGGTAPYSFGWEFGDGGISSAQNPSHTYSASGNYGVTFTVTDGTSAQATATVSITVSSNSAYSLSLASQTGSPAPGEGGTTEPAPGAHSFPIGSSVPVNSVPNTDYRFSKWSGDIAETFEFSAQTNVIMDNNKDLSATFCTKCADVNGDLKVTPADAQAAFDIFLGKIANPTWCESENADVNCSGTKSAPKITPADAQTIFNKYLKKGDVTSDCSGNSRSATVSAETLAGPETQLTLGIMTDPSGGDISIPIIVESSSGIDSFGFDLAFPSKALTFIRLEKAELTDGYDQLAANVLVSPLRMNAPEEMAPVHDFGFGTSFGPITLPSLMTLGMGTETLDPDQFFDQSPRNMIDYSVLRVGGFKSESTLNPSSGVLVTLIFRVTSELKDPQPLKVLTTYDDIQRALIADASISSESNRQDERQLSVQSKRLARKRYDF